MHHYPHHIGDYRTHTAHLTMVEDGAYRRLLDIYYMHERPLPADIACVQRLASARSKEERAAVGTILHEFFILEEDGWHQRRADDEISAYQARAGQARKNGKGGGRPKTGSKPKNNQPGYSTDTESEPSEKLTVNRKPGTNNQEPEEEEGGAIAPSLPIAEAVDLFNRTADEGGWPKVQVLNPTRKRALTACLRAVGGIDGWQSMLAKASASDFLTGKSERSNGHANWRMDFDFLVKPMRYTKLMEGGYDNSPNAQRPPERGLGAALAALAD